MKKKHFNKGICTLLALAMTVTMFAGMSITVFADDAETNGMFDYPTSAISTDDNVLKGASSQAGTSIIDIMGMDCVGGTTTNPEPTNLEEARSIAYFGTWGSNINSDPDPYAWNRFYNFYANETEGVDTVTNAMTISNLKTGYLDTYGTNGGLLANRPDIVVAFGATDYGADLELINSYKEGDEYYQEGDENYAPTKFEQYNSSNIGTMIQSMYALADTMNEVAEETGKTASRYGDPVQIAEDYENYVYGFQSYVQKVLAENGGESAKKTVTWVTGINDDGTYTITTGGSGHPYEFVAGIANLLPGTDEEKQSTGRNGQTTTSIVRTVTEAELMESDVIILWADMNFQKNLLSKFKEKFGTVTGQEYKGIISEAYPLSTYGMIANTVEIAQGFPFVAGTLYYDLGINPVEWLAYYYEKFYHVTDRAALEKMIEVYYKDASLPEGCSTTLPSDYSIEKIEGLIAEGKAYYAANYESFQNDDAKVTGLDGWFTPITIEDFSVSSTEHNDADAELNQIINISVKFSQPIKLLSDDLKDDIEILIAGENVYDTARTVTYSVDEEDPSVLDITLTSTDWVAIYSGLLNINEAEGGIKNIVAADDESNTAFWTNLETYITTGIAVENVQEAGKTTVTVTHKANMRGMYHFQLLSNGEPVASVVDNSYYANSMTSHAHNFYGNINESAIATAMATAINKIEGYTAVADGATFTVTSADPTEVLTVQMYEYNEDGRTVDPLLWRAISLGEAEIDKEIYKHSTYEALQLAMSAAKRLIGTNPSLEAQAEAKAAIQAGIAQLELKDVEGWIQNSDGKWLFYVNNEFVTGWKELEYNGSNAWYYFDSEGIMATGWVKPGNVWYYLLPSGRMATGWQLVNGKWYYMSNSGAMTTGWQSINGKWYYMSNSGAMTTGWQLVNGKWYYMSNSGAMVTGWLNINGSWYYMNASGAMVSGNNVVINGRASNFTAGGRWIGYAD